MATTLETIQGGNIDEIKKLLLVRPEFEVSQKDALKQYTVTDHDVFDKTLDKRPDKTIKYEDGVDDEGKPIIKTRIEPVVRVGLSYQETIVNRATGFMLSNPIRLESKMYSESESGKKLIQMVEKVWKDNKMDWVLPEMSIKWMSEMEVAMLFYINEIPNYWGELSSNPKMIKTKILASSLGDTLYPHFDETGDMDAFTRTYVTDVNGEKVKNMDIYTALTLYKYENDVLIETFDAPDKIMVVYIPKKKPEWVNVQSAIDRLETSISNHGDTNEYNGAPILFTKGVITGAPAKGSRGKAISSVDSSGDAKYLSWDSAPESIALEQKNLKNAIFELTQTPDISFDSVRGLGNVATATLTLMFSDAHMKSSSNWRVFGLGVERMLNIIKAVICRVIEVSLSKEEGNVSIAPIMTPFLPKNETEQITNVSNAYTSGVITRETAYENNPLISNVELEKERYNEESGESLGANVNP